MINTILSKRIGISLGTYATSHRSYHAGKGGSVNTAIARGLRKSRGLGFRGKAVKDPNDPREKYRSRHGIDAYSPPQSNGDTGVGNYKAGRDKPSFRVDDARSRNHIGRLERGPERRGRFGELIKGGTLRKVEYKEKPGRGRDEKGGISNSRDGTWPTQKLWDRTGKRESRTFFRRDAIEGRSSRRDSDRGASRSENSWTRGGKRELFKRQDDSRSKSFGTDSRKYLPSSSSSTVNRARESPGETPRSKDRSSSAGDGLSSYSAPKFPSSRHEHSVNRDIPREGTFQKRSEASRDGRSSDRNYRYSASEEIDNKGTSEVKPRFTQTIDNRIPVFIPYTTPAS
jgi:21S rRNA (GM2251-2'-O)-methyltransferase